MEAVAAGDDVAHELLVPAFVAEADRRRRGVEVVERHALDLVPQVTLRGHARRDQILDHLALPVDHDRASAGELVQIDAMATPAESDLDAVVHEPFGVDPLAETYRAQKVDDALFENAGTNARDHVLLRAVLEHDRLDPLAVEKMREEQPGRPCADDPHLRPRRHRASPAARSARTPVPR